MSEIQDAIALSDGTIVRIPGLGNLSDDQVTSILIKSLPGKMANLGFSENLEREYNIRDGVPDLGLRFQEALTGGDAREIRAVFNERVGDGNWGVEPNTKQLYVTPQGLTNLGITPKDNRNVFLDGTETDIYDFSADIAPELAIGAASVAAEVLVPIPGTGFLGPLAVRSAAAGLGGSLGRGGLELTQELMGYNRESVAEIIQQAGTEGAVIAGATLALGAPFAAFGSVANRVKQASDDLIPSAPQPTRIETAVANMREAEAKVSGRVSKEDAMLLSLRTLVGDEGTVAGNLLTKLEGVGAKQAGDQFAARAANLVEKYKRTYLASIRSGDDELTTLAKLKTVLSKEEQGILQNSIKAIKNFDETNIGKADLAGTTLKSFKNFAEQRLLQQYKAGQEAFSGPSYYGQFNRLEGKDINNQRLSNLINRISEDSGILVDDVYNAFSSANSPLRTRLSSRVRISDKTQKAMPVQGKKSKKTGERPDKGSGTRITANDLLQLDKQLRQASYKTSSANQSRVNLEISKSLQKQLEKLPEFPAKFRAKLQEVNREYSNFVTPYRGKNGLFSQIAERPQADAQSYLSSFVKGKDGAEFSTLLDKLDKAFGPNAIGGKLGLADRDEILSAIGMNFIRENKIDIVGAADPSKIAKDSLKRINSIENTIKKQMGSGAGKATQQIFKGNALQEYKKLLTDVASGVPVRMTKAMEELGMVMSFNEARQFVNSVNTVASSLSKADLNTFALSLKALDKLSPKSAAFVKDLMFADNWSRLFKATEAQNAQARLLGIKQWADDWTAAVAKDETNMKYIFGEMYEGVNDFALNMKGALNIDPVAGALSVAENTVGLFRKIITLNFSAVRKPLAFIFATKQFAPGAPGWNTLNKRLTGGESASEISKEKLSGLIGGLGNLSGKAQKYSSQILMARDGLVAASIAHYLEEANQSYPLEEEVPKVMPRKIETSQEEPQPQPQLQQSDGIAAIQKIAEMISGVGVSGLEEGAAIARGR